MITSNIRTQAEHIKQQAQILVDRSYELDDVVAANDEERERHLRAVSARAVREIERGLAEIGGEIGTPLRTAAAG